MRSAITDAFIEREAARKFPYVRQFAGFTITVQEGVYPPSEDSLILIKAIEKSSFCHARAKCLDFGTGTGVFALALARLGASVVAIDVNASAVQCAEINAEINHLQSLVDVRHGNGFSVIEEQETFDVVLASLPFESYEARNDFERSVYDEGYSVRKAFFRDVKKHLRSGGRIFYTYADYAEQQAPLASFLEGYTYKIIFEEKSSDGELNQVYQIEPSN